MNAALLVLLWVITNLVSDMIKDYTAMKIRKKLEKYYEEEKFNLETEEFDKIKEAEDKFIEKEVAKEFLDYVPGVNVLLNLLGLYSVDACVELFKSDLEEYRNIRLGTQKPKEVEDKQEYFVHYVENGVYTTIVFEFDSKTGETEIVNSTEEFLQKDDREQYNILYNILTDIRNNKKSTYGHSLNINEVLENEDVLMRCLIYARIKK